MSNLTFRSRLALWFSLILAGCLLLTGAVFSFTYFGVSLINLENFMLRESGEIAEKHFEIVNETLYFKKDEKGNTLASYLRDEGLSAVILDSKEKMIASYGVYSGLLEDNSLGNLIKKEEVDLAVNKTKSSFSFSSLYDARTYLTMTEPVLSGNKVVGILVLAADMDIGKQMLVFSLILMILILPLSLTVGGIATYYLVGKSFRPLEKILSKMKRVRVGSLTNKIDIKGNPRDELVRLTMSYNEMLNRLNEGVEKQKDFATKVSHELKTPLTQAVLGLDLAESYIQSKDYVSAREELETAKYSLKNFGELINSLLSLAKIKTIKIKRSSLRVADESKKIISGYKDILTQKQMRVEYQGQLKIKFRFSTEEWRLIFANLFSNAVKYGKDKTRVTVKFGVTDEEGYLSITNRGENLNAEEAVKVWQKFYRTKRAKKVEGLGIGLAVVKEVADFNQLSLKVERVLGGGVRVIVSGFEISE